MPLTEATETKQNGQRIGVFGPILVSSTQREIKKYLDRMWSKYIGLHLLDLT